MQSRIIGRVVAALLLWGTLWATLWGSMAPASAQQTFGPEFGNNKFTAELTSLTARPDTDDFVADLVAGESFSVTASAKKSALHLSVVVIDPNGADRTADGKVKIKKNGAKVSVSGITADITGRWTVRLEAIDGTEGLYQAAFKVASPKPIKLKKQVLGGAAPSSRDHVFGGDDAALLSIKLKGSKKLAALRLDDLVGPDGRVAGIFGEDDVALRVKGTTTSLKNHALGAGFGDYTLTVGADGPAVYSLLIKVAPPPRARGATILVSRDDPHLDLFPDPVRSAAGQPVRITGRGFALSPFPRVFFGRFEATVVGVGPAQNFVDVIVPPGEDGTTQDVTVTNPSGQSAYAADFIIYVPEAAISGVTVASGPISTGNEIRREGGAVLRVDGSEFVATDTVTLNATPVVKQGFSSTSFQVAVPAGAAGAITLEMTDEFGRVQTVADVAHRVGFAANTAARSPGASFDDDLSAFDAAIGDLDRDGRVDDLVIVTYNRHSRLYPEYYLNPGPGYVYLQREDNPVGLRTEYTRLFETGNDGRLTDTTSGSIPDAQSDSRSVEDFNALAVALGDVDGMNGTDIVLGGSRGKDDLTTDFPTVRVLTNSGSGNFSLAEGLAPASLVAGTAYAVDETYVPPDPDPDPDEEPPPVIGFYNVAGKRTAPDVVVALAVGDLDGDGAPEIVAGAPGHGYRYVFVDPSYVDFSQTPPYIPSTDVHYVNDGFYYSGTRVFSNRTATAGGFVDVSESVLPSAGTVSSPGAVAFPARDLVLGDVDGDTDLDLIVTFNNPAATIPASAAANFGEYAPYSYGRYQYYYNAASAQRAVATRVLLNDGYGTFTDATSSWLPAGAGDEWWQAHRIAFADLDADGDRDLVLIHRRALNVYRYTASQTPPATSMPSLRILRNDGPETGFTDVTASALPAGSASLRGRAVAIGDLDQDGFPEVIVGTRESLQDGGGAPQRATRILWGGAGLVFEFRPDFETPASVDSGEVLTILVEDMDRNGLNGLLFLGEDVPAVSEDGELLRFHEWLR